MRLALTEEQVDEEVDHAADHGVDDPSQRDGLPVGPEHRVGAGEDDDGRERRHQRRVRELRAVAEEAGDGHLRHGSAGGEVIRRGG